MWEGKERDSVSHSVASDSVLPHGQAPLSMRGKDTPSYFITELGTSSKDQFSKKPSSRGRGGSCLQMANRLLRNFSPASGGGHRTHGRKRETKAFRAAQPVLLRLENATLYREVWGTHLNGR